MAARLPGVDSINMWPALSGATDRVLRSEVLLGTSLMRCKNAALIQGAWKIRIDDGRTPSPGEHCCFECPASLSCAAQNRTVGYDKQSDCLRWPNAAQYFSLVHLSSDPTERTNLAAAHPERLQAMVRRLRQLADEAEYQPGVAGVPLPGPAGPRDSPIAALCEVAPPAPAPVVVQTASGAEDSRADLLEFLLDDD